MDCRKKILNCNFSEMFFWYFFRNIFLTFCLTLFQNLFLIFFRKLFLTYFPSIFPVIFSEKSSRIRKFECENSRTFILLKSVGYFLFKKLDILTSGMIAIQCVCMSMHLSLLEIKIFIEFRGVWVIRIGCTKPSFVEKVIHSQLVTYIS